MIKSALIIVPHHDDELNIAGCILQSLKDANVSLSVLYVTRGDYYKDKFSWRMQERDKVLKIWGIQEYKQLNWPDSYLWENHIFNDYSQREKIRCDMKQYILEKQSDLIICVDYDTHADHRMVSFLFDDIMNELLKKQDYFPIILKKFAYLGVWEGEFDYFESKLIPTKNVFDDKDDEERKYLNCLPYSWGSRIRVKTDKVDAGPFFWKSKVFKSYCTYMTQCGFSFFFRCVNSDVVFWYRNTKNLLYSALVSCTSGNCMYINDFAIARISHISEKFEGINRFEECAWIPAKSDSDKIVKARWDKSVDIGWIKLYQNFRSIGHIDLFEVSFSNGYTTNLSCSDNDEDVFNIPTQKHVIWMKVKILQSSGMAGIRELEVFSDSPRFPWDEVPFAEYEESEEKKKYNGICYIMFKLFWFLARANNKLRKKIHLSHWS